MRNVALLFAAAALAGCGANYEPSADLPRLNPGVCAPCSADADCGPGAYCAAEGDDPPEFCTAPCDANWSCPDGQTCNDFGNGMSGCYPSSNTCKGGVVVGPTAGNGGGDGTIAGDGTTTGDATAAGTTTTGTTTSAASTSTTGTTTTTGTTGTTGTQSASSSSTGTTGTHSSSTSGSTSGTTGNACTPDTWATTMHGFFNTYCNGCHSFTSVSAVRSEASSIKSRISSGSMPRGRSLTSAQKNAVIDWINCGEP